jgi:hypothetical protein
MPKRFSIIDIRYDSPYCGLENISQENASLLMCVPATGQPAISDLLPHQSTVVTSQGMENEKVMSLRVVRLEDAE